MWGVADFTQHTKDILGVAALVFILSPVILYYTLYFYLVCFVFLLRMNTSGCQKFMSA